MSLSQFVQVSIAVLSAGITQAGFGKPMILSHSATWPERTRTYTSLPGVLADFGATTPEYLASQVLFSQSPSPDQLVIGRSAVKPTMAFQFDVVTVANSTAYSARVGAQTATYTSDGTATNDEIATGFAAALTALAVSGWTAATAGVSGSLHVTYTATTPGAWIGLEVLRSNLLSVAETQADPGLAAELSAILDENATWYTLVTTFNSKLYIAGAAAWIEANERTYVVATQDTACANVAAGSATDIAHTLSASAYMRTMVIYHPANDAFMDVGWDGVGLPTTPGSETWKFMTVATVPPVVLTATQITNLEAKNCNYYLSVNGKNITANGMVASGEWFDVVRLRDWLKARMQERLFVLLTQGAAGSIAGLATPQKKIPYNDAGIALVQAVMMGVLLEAVSNGGLNPGSISVTVPKAGAASSADKTARLIKGITFAGTLAGAIHKIVINGTLTE